MHPFHYFCIPMSKFLSLLAFSQLIFLGACSSSYSNVAIYDIKPLDFEKEQLPQLEILDAKSLHLKDNQQKAITELSGIAWDNDENILYAVSDEGMLYHLRLVIKDDQLQSVDVLKEYYFYSKKDKKLKGKWSDTEGLALKNNHNGKKGDTQLIVSFENKPRVNLYSPIGKFIKNIKIPKKLTKRKSFRHRNKALESVTYHNEYGVITAGEYPLKDKPKNVQTIYSANGHEWSFIKSPAKNSAITGIELLDGGQELLVLERAWSGVANPLQIRLSSINTQICDKHKFCQQTILGDFSTGEGWQLDNFEGLAALAGNHFLMISDDNQSRLQRTVLVLFRVDSKR